MQFHSPGITNFLNRTDLEGDSAGLALGLSGLYEKGELKNEVKIAVTGALAADGSVSPVGGVKSKIIIAEQHGISYIILPKENVVEAEKAKLEGNLKIEIIVVEHTDQAVSSIAEINQVN